MVQFVACYDLTAAFDPWEEFLDQAETLGWSRWIWGVNTNKWRRLPNTTIIGDFANASSAKVAFDAAVAATGTAIGSKVKVTKYLIGTFAATSYSSDEDLDPE